MTTRQVTAAFNRHVKALNVDVSGGFRVYDGFCELETWIGNIRGTVATLGDEERVHGEWRSVVSTLHSAIARARKRIAGIRAQNRSEVLYLETHLDDWKNSLTQVSLSHQPGRRAAYLEEEKNMLEQAFGYCGPMGLLLDRRIDPHMKKLKAHYRKVQARADVLESNGMWGDEIAAVLKKEFSRVGSGSAGKTF